MSISYSLTTVTHHSSSLLREEFDSINGRITSRKVDIDKVSDHIVDLASRPDFCPLISVFQFKSIDEEHAYVFSEKIYTSNEFASSFEQFLRDHVRNIPADKFENVPDSRRHFFGTHFTLVPCDVKRITLSPIPLKNKLVKIEHDQFHGVDYTSSCTLRMIDPLILYAKLS